jgi:2-amino-4-hydroxy-6-hydroxymethyldihydropteridine diphosphokinase
MRMEKSYIGLGSNLGRRRSMLRQALQQMERRGIAIESHSSLWESEPVDAPGTPWFLNMAVGAGCEMEPSALLECLLSIEVEMGRVRGEVNAPRTLDLDLLLFGDRLLDEPQLIVPHPRMWERRFVLAPLAEIAPGLTDPRGGVTVRERLAQLPQEPIVKQVGSLRVADILASTTRKQRSRFKNEVQIDRR